MSDIFGAIVVGFGLLIAVSPLVVISFMFINAWIYDFKKWFKNY